MVVKGKSHDTYKGVYTTSKEGQFSVRVTIDGVKESLGPFDSDVEAAKAFDRRKIESGKEPVNFPREVYEGSKTPSRGKKSASKKKPTTPQPATPSTKTQKPAGKTPSPRTKKQSSPVVKATTVVPAAPAQGTKKDTGLLCTVISIIVVLLFLGVVTYGWCTEEFTLSGLYGEMKNTVDWEGMYLKTKHVKGNVFGYVLRLIKKDEL